MRGKLQHHFNSLHVFCRLCSITSRQRARTLAQSWASTRIYRRIYA